MPIPIVSFYGDIDDSRYYSTCARRLVAQCDRLGIAHHVVERRYGSDWIANVKAKPTFLREMYDELGVPFLWVDVDCDVLRYPADAEELSCDWGVVPKPGQLYVCDCVHFVGHSFRARALLDRWIERCSAPGTAGSHSGFCNILPGAVREGLRLAYLPESYVHGPVIQIGLAEIPSKIDYLAAMKCRSNAT
ncbi:MAG TPA: hypothetical protein VGQ37_22430 [Vicinamibacterales bacterium]|jgi:hypothetical protein|nr:hypothetical protein [Vicinamibacterales bacterium]